MKSIYLYLIGLAIVLGSCKKSNNQTFLEGTVYYSDPAMDGCGWAISTSEREYFPDNLGKKFQKNGLKVLFTFEKSGYRPCAWGEVEKINVKSIKIK